MKNGKKFESFPETEMEKLLEYNWPGNVRELENSIERAVVMSKEKNLKLKYFQFLGKNKNSIFNGILL